MVITKTRERGSLPFGDQIIGNEAAEHEDIAVGEIYEPQHPVDHRIAEGYKGIDGAELKAVDELLEYVAENFQNPYFTVLP